MNFLGALAVLLSLLVCTWSVDGGQTPTPCSKQLGKSVPRYAQPPIKGNTPLVCASNKTCCSRQLEEALEKRVVIEMKGRISTKYEEVEVSVLTLHQDLKGYFQGMLRESFHKTLYWLSKSHKNLTSSSEHLLKELFRDMEGYVGDSTIDVRKSIDQFFKESFPLLYIYLLPAGKTPTSSYKKCLMDKFDAIQPFGNKPEEFSKTLIEKLSPVQILLRSLVFSAKVITTAKEFNFTSECSVSLLKMNYCPLCQGVNDIKPCHGFCVDLLRKCLATEIQLQVDWDDYIKSLVFLTDALSKSDLQDFTSEMYKYLLNAATSVLIYKETLLPKVLNVCGKPTYQRTPSLQQSSDNPEPTMPTHTKIPISTKMEILKPKVDFFGDLFLDLPKGICDDQLAAKQSKVDGCWNGDAKARYTGLKNPRAFQASSGDTHKLKRLVESIKDMTELVKTSTLILRTTEIDEDEDSSGSGTSGDNNIRGSGGCSSVDDEDCGSGSGENMVNGGEAGSNDDMFFSKTTAISNDLDGGVAAGGISTDKPNNDNGLGLEQINGSPASSCSKWQNLILMAGFVIVLSLK